MSPASTLHYVLDVLLRLSTYALILFLTRCVLVYGYRMTLHPLSKYPGPTVAACTDWYTAHYAMIKRLHLVTYQDHQKYGNPPGCWFCAIWREVTTSGSVVRQGPNKLVFNSYKALQDIYQSDRTNKVTSYLATQIKPKTYSVFNCIDKRLHKIKRRIIAKALSEQKMRQFEPTMTEHVNIFLKQILLSARKSELVDMSDRCKRLGVDIIGRFGFGYKLDMQTNDAHLFMLQGLAGASYKNNVYIQAPMVKWFGLEFFFPMLYALRMKYYFLLKHMVKTRLAEGKQAKEDLFSYVMDAKDPETGTKINLGELVSEATFFFPAGGDTTATTITAAFFYLSRSPDAYANLTTEIRTTFSKGADICAGEALSSCTYLRAVIDEAMRISPPVSGTLWRELPTGDAGSDRPLIVDGHEVPAGVWVGVNMYAIHHNEEYFPRPFAFKPERWLHDESVGGKSESLRIQKDVFSAFGRGPRSCAGKAMAYLEASLVLAKTLWYFDVERPSDPAMDSIGGGKVGDATGRERPGEFQIYDQFIADHHGPCLLFKARPGFYDDIE